MEIQCKRCKKYSSLPKILISYKFQCVHCGQNINLKENKKIFNIMRIFGLIFAPAGVIALNYILRYLRNIGFVRLFSNLLFLIIVIIFIIVFGMLQRLIVELLCREKDN